MKTGQPTTNPKQPFAALLTLIIPFVLWPIVFNRILTDFWSGLAIATAILLILSAKINRGLYLSASVPWIVLGAASGFIMYGGFFLGFQATRGIAAFSGGISSIYQLKTSSLLFIGALLVFPIGPGEEIYWRGLIQRKLQGTGRRYAWILQAIPYTLIHAFTLNPPLLITALIGGLAWGYLYKLSGSITPSILSHTIFDLLIFVILPFS
jgi:CAAX protease family protein